MTILTKIRQYYRYRRNLKKFNSRVAKGGKYKNLQEQLNFYKQFISTGDLVYDIGANTGEKTDIFLRLGAKVVAVEPQESCWRVIKQRFHNKQDIFIEPIVLSESEGYKTLYVDKSPTISSISTDWIKAVKESGRFSDSHKWSYNIQVKSSTLDDLMKKYGKPVFCKIDVEGAEFEVLQGLSQPINTISLEFIPERIEFSLRCIDYLDKLGIAEYNYCIGDSMSFALPSWVKSSQMKTVLTQMAKRLDNFGDIYAHFTNHK